MTDEEILTEFIREIDCEDESLDFRKFVYETVAFKRYKLTKDWTNVKEDLLNEIYKFIGNCHDDNKQTF